MTRLPGIPHLLTIALFLSASPVCLSDDARFLEPLRPMIRQTVGEMDQIPPDRREVLTQSAERIAESLRTDGTINLKFICTHNSRRSHLSQVWAEAAAAYFEISGITTSSGGTAVTACNPRTIRSLRRSGFSVVQTSPGDNPVYLLQYGEDAPVLRLYSKLHDAPEQPDRNFIAMLCCADADESCPEIPGALARVPLHYADPKSADGTPHEAAAYDQCSHLIAAEMFYLMSRVAALRKGTNPLPTASE